MSSEDKQNKNDVSYYSFRRQEKSLKKRKSCNNIETYRVDNTISSKDTIFNES